MAACMCNIESVETQAHEDAQKKKKKTQSVKVKPWEHLFGIQNFQNTIFQL